MEVYVSTNRRATMAKRERERARQQRRQEKAEKRAQRQAAKRERPANEQGVDPDIADIVVGPQPPQE
jgi:hypothetical protein